MALLAEWSKLSQADFDFICTPPLKESEKHHEKLHAVFVGQFAAALVVWNKLPKTQWENTRATSRDLPEWKDLVEVLIPFRKALKKVRRLPKKETSDAESKTSEVSE